MTGHQLSRSNGVSEAAGAFQRSAATGRAIARAAACLAPALLLAGCGSSAMEKAMSEKLAKAEAAADRAVKAQEAAEHAAATAGASTQTFVADEEPAADDNGPSDGDGSGENLDPAPPEG
jgi:hypothetical protein